MKINCKGQSGIDIVEDRSATVVYFKKGSARHCSTNTKHMLKRGTEDPRRFSGKFRHIHTRSSHIHHSRTNVHQNQQNAYHWKGLTTYIMNHKLIKPNSSYFKRIDSKHV